MFECDECGAQYVNVKTPKEVDALHAHVKELNQFCDEYARRLSLRNEENARLQKLVDMNQKVVDAARNQVKLQEKNTVPSLIRAIRELDGGNVADKN